MSTEIPDLLTRREAAKVLRMGISTLDGQIREGKIAVVQPGGPGTKVLVPASEIERLTTPKPRRRDPYLTPTGARLTPEAMPAVLPTAADDVVLPSGARILAEVLPVGFGEPYPAADDADEGDY